MFLWFGMLFQHPGPTWDGNGMWKFQTPQTQISLKPFEKSFCNAFERPEASQFTLIFESVFDRPFGKHFLNFVVPQETHFESFSGYGWNMKAMVSWKRNHNFDGWRGSRESSCAALCAQCFSTCFSEWVFCYFWRIWRPIGGPSETLGGHFFGLLAHLFRGQFLNDFGVNLGRGPRQGQGLSSMHIM